MMKGIWLIATGALACVVACSDTNDSSPKDAGPSDAARGDSATGPGVDAGGGADGGGKGNGSGGSMNPKCNGGGSSGGDADPCGACMMRSCTKELEKCFGPGWTSGDLSKGDCGEYGSCLTSCACDDANCETNCMQKASSGACIPCLMGMDGCRKTSCPTDCADDDDTGGKPDAGIGNPDTGTSGGGCAALKSCCEKAPEQMKSGCDQAVAAGNDTGCDALLGTFKTGGFC